MVRDGLDCYHSNLREEETEAQEENVVFMIVQTFRAKANVYPRLQRLYGNNNYYCQYLPSWLGQQLFSYNPLNTFRW